MRAELSEAISQLHTLGYNLAGTPGTAEYYTAFGIPVLSLSKPPDDGEESVLTWIKNRKIDLVVNIPEGSNRRDEVSSGYLMRRAAVDYGTALLTNIKCAVMFCEALSRNKTLPCKSCEEFIGAPTIGWSKDRADSLP